MYYLQRRGMVTGPHSVEQLERMRYSGHLLAQDQLSTDRLVWVNAGDVLPLLFGLVPAPELANLPGGDGAAGGDKRNDKGLKKSKWFYVHPATRTREGPVGLEDMATLARARQIKRSTLVWQNGMAQWIRADKALPEIFPGRGFNFGLLALLVGMICGVGLAAWLLYLALAGQISGENRNAPVPEKPPLEAEKPIR